MQKEPVPLLAIAQSFLRLGSTVFGGMWGGTSQLERELVQRRGWVTTEELHIHLVASTLMPSTRFVGLAGLVGFQMRGWVGSVVAVASLLLPSSLMILLCAALVNPHALGDRFPVLQRALGIAIVAILAGNAYQQLQRPGLSGLRWVRGIAVTLAVAAGIVYGVPLVVAAVGGLVAGWWLVQTDSR